MCTALSFKTKDHYFGRNLDLDYSYHEEVCIMPRNYPLKFRLVDDIDRHYAMIGMATVFNDVPLFYDAVNEYGLGMAGLNFPDNAVYFEKQSDKDNITPFEFIPWILGKCKTVVEVKALLARINIVNLSFSEELPSSPLHWIIADSNASIVVESMYDGLHIYDNPVGVLTNNPPFDYQLFNLNNFRNLKVVNGDNTFVNTLELHNYCQGLGSIGLPGDVSSMSRFVRMTFNALNSVCKNDENSSVSQFFHLLSSVAMVRGVCVTPANHCDITVYSACCNATKGIYYYKTYNNHQINAVNMHKVDLNIDTIYRFPLALENNIHMQN